MDLPADPDTPPEQALRWVVESLPRGGRIVSVYPLHGSWHVNHAIDVIDRDGRLHQVVLRRWARPGWELTDPDFTADREAAILRLLAGTRVPAPLLVAADSAGRSCDVPGLLVTRLPGQPPGQALATDSYLDQLAAVLRLIHSVNGQAWKAVPAYSRYYEPDQIVLPKWIGPSRVWQRAVEIVARNSPVGPTGFIHRDYHPGNTLWSEGRLTGVVDWTQGSWGPPSVDLGHMRWNLAARCGPEVADRFLDLYRAPDTFEHDAYWDVVTIIDLVADVDRTSPLPRSYLDRLEQYLDGVLAKL